MRMAEAGQAAGRQVMGTGDNVKIFNAMKNAGKKIAQQYAKVDKIVARAAYVYYVNGLKNAYRSAMYTTSESSIRDLCNIIIESVSTS
jgi:hypothetical protein